MMVRRILPVLVLAGLLTAPLVLAQPRDAPAYCDANRDGRITPGERQACFDRCDTDKDAAISESERVACAERAREARANPTGDCREALELAQAQRDRMRANITARWQELRTQQDARAKAFGGENHTEEEWTVFRSELGAERSRAEAAVANLSAQLEQRIGRLQSCAGVAAAGRYASCDQQPADYARFRRMVERETMEFTESIRARVREANATTSEERASHEARADAAIAQYGRQLEEKWQALRDAHARSCLREVEGKRTVREIQADVRADRLACTLQAEAVLDPFLDANGRAPDAWTEAQRQEFAGLRIDAAKARAGCERELAAEWKADVRAKFNETARRDRFGTFDISAATPGTGTATGRYVTLAWDESPFTISDYATQGLVLIESFSSPHAMRTPRFDGGRIAIGGAEDGMFQLAIHDNPTAGFAGRCAAPGCTLVVPEGTGIVEKPGENENGTTRYELALGDTRAFLFAHGTHAWTGETLEITGSWRLLAPSENFVLENVANRHRDRITSAIADGAVLAEINVVAAENATVVAQTVDVAALDADGAPPAVAVAVAHEAHAIVVELASDASEGSSVVINVDQAALGGDIDVAIPVDDIVVSYVEVAADGTETTVALAAADSVEDALVADENVPEAFVVVGDDGVQVIVSNPHYSAKTITIGRESQQPPPETRTEPTPSSPTPDASSGDKGAPGLGLVALAALVVAVAVGLRRRRGG